MLPSTKNFMDYPLRDYFVGKNIGIILSLHVFLINLILFMYIAMPVIGEDPLFIVFVYIFCW